MRIGTLVDEGIVVSLHADTPVAPPRPLEEVWIAVNRIGALSGEVRGPGERVSVDKALRRSPSTPPTRSASTTRWEA
jgi:predicted amidohydrolase YtcJ